MYEFSVYHASFPFNNIDTDNVSEWHYQGLWLSVSHIPHVHSVVQLEMKNLIVNYDCHMHCISCQWCS